MAEIIKRKQVAELAGVSEATVSYVVNGRSKVSEETRQKVLAAMKELGYMTNLLARSMKTKRTMQIAVIVSYLGNPFEAGILIHLEEAAREAGYMLVFQTYPSELNRPFIELFHGRVDGIIFLGQTLDPETTEHLREYKLPFLFLMQPVDYRKDWLCLDIDWTAAYRRIIQQLTAGGHQRIGFMTNGNPQHYHEYRFQCFLKAMEAEDISFIKEDGLLGGGMLETAEKFLKQRLANDPSLPFTALVCANDLMAIGAVAACRVRGLHIPEQLAIVGSEDILMASHSNPPIASIHVPRNELGTIGMRMILDIIEGQLVESITLEPGE
ncbi:MAG: LacI family transcriptional regulator [Gorillibacterium sp.]|nr:LacI family transcriptional regulator [Gorillibacterium sp.]